MPEMDVTHTEFDPTLDEPRWNVVIDTAKKQYKFAQIGEAQMKQLRRLTQGYNYEWTGDNEAYDYIWAQPVERVVITKGKTQREINKRRQEEYSYRRTRRY